ncbi:MAG: hypothetical protein ACTSXL_04625 [Alphaproteobacteria bacterium]
MRRRREKTNTKKYVLWLAGVLIVFLSIYIPSTNQIVVEKLLN